MTSAIASSNIARQAFRFMELRPLQSFGENSDQARAAEEQYPNALDMVLEAYDWSFARRLLKPAMVQPVATLAVDPDLPFAYDLPVDLLTIRKIYGAETGRWRLDERLLRTDFAGPLVRGTVRKTNENQLPATVRTVIACQLAVLLSSQFVSSRTKRVEIDDNLLRVFQQAKDNDLLTASAARLDGLDPSVSSDWVGQVLS
ncbi:hypothetical protein [Pseudooceanicola algae]|uniref:Uncharacterized protein n=1 Tax=Pseudooceanicola algae TaxID=1537215 RepID=A0A418SK62_9RHOB|nr:hypothetical protein [Pseudooceanicola algae]QPM89155.1 hypothetical protein PSAL_003660 [Pseudooceanicola algae]